MIKSSLRSNVSHCVPVGGGRDGKGEGIGGGVAVSVGAAVGANVAVEGGTDVGGGVSGAPHEVSRIKITMSGRNMFLVYIFIPFER